jgi:hypothetical protein
MLVRCVLVGSCALAAVAGCTKPMDIHDTSEAKGETCVTCHGAAYSTATNPKHVGVLSDGCIGCHTTNAWAPATIAPDVHTWFPLTSKHSTPQCADCHTKGYRQGDTPTACVGCHQKDYDGTTDPAHKDTGISTDCTTCHDDKGWRPALTPR